MRVGAWVCAGLLAFAFAGTSQASIIFANFNVDEGLFNQHPTFSGTSNVATSSTADRVTTAPLEGAGCEQLVIDYKAGGVASQRVRWVNNGGTPVAGNIFQVTAGTDGRIGYYVKTSTAGLKASIYLDDSSNAGAGMDSGILKNITADGQWHLYEWDIDVASDWKVASGIGGNGILEAGQHSIDSLWLEGFTTGNTPATVFIDFVAKSDSGSIAALVPEPATMVLLGIGGLLFRRRRTA